MHAPKRLQSILDGDPDNVAGGLDVGGAVEAMTGVQLVSTPVYPYNNRMLCARWVSALPRGKDVQK